MLYITLLFKNFVEFLSAKRENKQRVGHDCKINNEISCLTKNLIINLRFKKLTPPEAHLGQRTWEKGDETNLEMTMISLLYP